MPTAMKEVLPEARPMVACTRDLWENMFSVINHRVLVGFPRCHLRHCSGSSNQCFFCRSRRTSMWIFTVVDVGALRQSISDDGLLAGFVNILVSKSHDAGNLRAKLYCRTTFPCGLHLARQTMNNADHGKCVQIERFVHGERWACSLPRCSLRYLNVRPFEVMRGLLFHLHCDLLAHECYRHSVKDIAFWMFRTGD